MNTLPHTAPRGKFFAVARMSHVGSNPAPHLVVSSHQHAALADAQAEAARIDWRLSPTVVLGAVEQSK